MNTAANHVTPCIAYLQLISGEDRQVWLVIIILLKRIYFLTLTELRFNLNSLYCFDFRWFDRILIFYTKKLFRLISGNGLTLTTTAYNVNVHTSVLLCICAVCIFLFRGDMVCLWSSPAWVLHLHKVHLKTASCNTYTQKECIISYRMYTHIEENNNNKLISTFDDTQTWILLLYKNTEFSKYLQIQE